MSVKSFSIFSVFTFTLALAIVQYLSDSEQGCISSEESSFNVCEAQAGAGRVMHIKTLLKQGQPCLAFPVCSVVGG